jgi:hypothetical protein
MKFNEITHKIALATLALYGIYSLFVLGVGGLLMSAAIGLITAAFVDSMEVIAAVTVIVGMIVSSVLAWINKKKGEGFVDGQAGEIIGLVDRLGQKRAEPMGTYSSSGVEGFADVSGSAALPAAAPAAPAAPATSSPAPADSSKPAPAADGFRSDEAGLFRLGELPSGKKDGPFLDAGSTLMKAIGALQPEQMKAMTEETQKMIETQKNMIGMLQNMRPVLQDGRQLLDSFSSIFGGAKI